jgi:hypothetical protein
VTGGALVDRLAEFARVLRAVGLPVGTARVVAAVEAVAAIGVVRRDDFYWSLHAVFVSRHDHHDIFDQAFAAFWRRHDPADGAMAALLPRLAGTAAPVANRRVAEALSAMLGDGPDGNDAGTDRMDDAVLTWSDRERLRGKDFEQMSAAETAAAKAVLTRFAWPVAPEAIRRFGSDPGGPAVDWRSSLRAMARRGGDVWTLSRRSRRCRRPPLVVLCDISGSMDRYARMMLHFLHTLARAGERLEVFLFGTRLTRVTRALAGRDVDDALAKVAAAVPDWAGGTRIGAAVGVFNRLWARRVLGHNAVVLLVTDGLDRDGGAGLGAEMARLGRLCRRLIWLNPLLRYAAFEPLAQGVRAILPHVDEVRPVHDLRSLEALAAALGGPVPRRRP